MSNEETPSRDSSLFGVTSEGGWIVLISGVLILAVLLISGFDYYYIDQGMTLLFYAVLVRIWTKIGADIPLFRQRDLAHAEFILNAVGGVIIGATIEWIVSLLTGDIITIQLLALAVVISRLYINIRDAGKTSLKRILRYHDPVDRYLILTPSTVAFSTPILLTSLAPRWLNFDTGNSFFTLSLASLGVGLLLYAVETVYR